jgi:hypothetical protein
LISRLEVRASLTLHVSHMRYCGSQEHMQSPIKGGAFWRRGYHHVTYVLCLCNTRVEGKKKKKKRRRNGDKDRAALTIK